MKKLLITGANGQLGQKINELLKDSYNLILTDYDVLNITNNQLVKPFIELNRPNFIIHCAAYTKVDLAEEEKELCYKINVDGTASLAKASAEFDIPIIYISSDYVFDGEKDSPYQETDPTNPLSVYGKSKLEGEKSIIKHCKKYFILRTSWLFGELPVSHPGSNFIETMLRLSKEKDSLSVVDDQIGSPTYTKDLVLAIDQFLKSKPLSGVYHFSGENQCSWYDFAKYIFEITKTKINLKGIKSVEFPQKAKRPPYSYMSKLKLSQDVGMQVRSWQEMVNEYLINRNSIKN